MVRLKFSIDLKYEIADYASDFIFNIHAAQTRCQSVVAEQLYLSQPVVPVIYPDPTYGTRYMRLKAEPGPLALRYEATVDIAHHTESPGRLAEVPIAQLPPEVLPYIYPSRYCQSDRLHRFATREFGHLRQGYWRGAGDLRLGSSPDKIPVGQLERQHVGGRYRHRAGRRVPFAAFQ